MKLIALIVEWFDKRLPGAANRHIGRVLEQRGL